MINPLRLSFFYFTHLTMNNMLNVSYILFLNGMFINSYFTIEQVSEKRIIIYVNEEVTGVKV